jgi:hypothetical protein
MISNRVAFVVLSAACVAAAAGGGYLANRQETAVVAQPAAAELADQLAEPVHETEAIIDDLPSPAPESVEPVAPAPEPRRREVEERRRTPTRPVSTEARSKPVPAPRPVAPPRVEPEVVAPPPLPEIPEPVPVPYVEQQPPTPPAMPLPVFQELVVAPDSVVGLQIESTISSEQARIEDRVDGRVIRDVRVGGDVAIPVGAQAVGVVTLVERGGKFKERARLGIRFHTLVLADGTQLPITTETIYRYGEPPGNSSAAKIGGGAVAGAILGAILGGGKGAAVGATAGAGGGTAAVVASDRNEATFAAGTDLTARILSPVTVIIEQ